MKVAYVIPNSIQPPLQLTFQVFDTLTGWSVKKATNGRDSYTFGYKVHILCDAVYELPLAVNVSAGNVHDVKEAMPLLSEARYTFPKFHPRYVLADAGYSSEAVRYSIHRQYRAEPIIDPNPSHKKAVAKTDKTADWKAIYAMRTAVERVNARLKGQYKLGDIRVRGKMKVMVHALMSAIVYQVQSLSNQVALTTQLGE